MMKRVKFLIAITFIFSACSCLAQKLVQEEKDVFKIKENENFFIGKPLSLLLSEIKPPINRVFATPSNNIYSYVGNFRFNFMDNKAVDSVRAKRKTPVTLVVFIKENFDYDFQKRPKGKETIWTQEDVKKYGNLTVVGFRISGNVTSDGSSRIEEAL